jgi:hypothetical protein
MMNKFQQKIYEDGHLYMPYSTKKQFPQAVSSAILKQNKLLKNTWAIVIVGIPRDVMPHLENTLLESSGVTGIGVTGISDTNQMDKSGRWNILVKELDFKSIRKRFLSKIQAWIRALPSEIQATIPDSFPPPKVYQKNGFDDNDDDDSRYGQASYMSSCAQSYASFDDDDANEQYYHPLSGVTCHASYAAAVSGTFPGYGGRGPPKEPIIPQHEPLTNIEITEFQSAIANLQNDVTIAQL